MVCASMKNRVRVSGTGFSNEASIRGGVSHPSITPVLSCYEMYPNSFLQACTASQIHITSWIGSGCWALSSYPMQVEASATAIAAKSRGHL